MSSSDPEPGTATTDILSTIGETPLVELSNASSDTDATIYAKLEFVNPSGSIKDRIYYEMITAAEDRGDLESDMEIVECSTGNAGIACTFVGSQLGYDVTIVMPEGMSDERKKVIRAYGGRLVETPGGESDVDLAVQRVEEMLDESPDEYWFPNQFSNPDNPTAHELTTGPEIVEQLGGTPDAFVAGQGTGALSPAWDGDCGTWTQTSIYTPSNRRKRPCCPVASGGHTRSKASVTGSFPRISTRNSLTA